MAVVDVDLAEPGGSTRDSPAVLIGRLYEQHAPMVRSLCRLLLRNGSEAEDAAQQTFLAAFGSLIGGTVPERPAAWLATIARRECWARTAHRRPSTVLLDDLPAAAADPLEHAIRTADLTAIWSALSDLPDQQRQAFLMREFAGLSYAQVAEALGASEPAVESLLVRARRQLRDSLGSVTGAAQAAITPLLLFQHRLGRLVAGRASAVGAGVAGSFPVAAKLGAALAGSAVLGASGVGIAIKVSHHHTPHRSAAGARAVVIPTGKRPEAERRAAPLRPSAEDIRTIVRRPTRARVGRGHSGFRSERPPTASWTATNAVATETSPSATPAGVSTGDPVDPREPSSAGASPAVTVDATQSDPAPTVDAVTTPADTVSTETSPTDTAPADGTCASPDDPNCSGSAPSSGP